MADVHEHFDSNLDQWLEQDLEQQGAKLAPDLLAQMPFLFQRNSDQRPSLSKFLSLFQERFQLTDFALDVLITLVAQASGFQSKGFPQAVNVEALRKFIQIPREDLTALSPEGPLLKWQLVRFNPQDSTKPLSTRTLLLDDWTLQVFLGKVVLGETLKHLVKFDNEPPNALSGEQRGVVQQLADQLAQRLGILQLHGRDAGLQRDYARAIAQTWKYTLFTVQAPSLVMDLVSLRQLALEWNRFARLHDALVLIEVGVGSLGENAAQSPLLQAVQRFLAALEGAVLVATRQPLSLGLSAKSVLFQVQSPTVAEQRLLWQAGLGIWLSDFSDEFLSRAVEECVNRFFFSGEQIHQALQNAPTVLDAVALELAKSKGDMDGQFEICLNAVIDAGNALSRPAFENLTELMRPAKHARWDQLVLEDRALSQLQTVVLHIKHRLKVYEQMGWYDQSSKGFAIVLLMSGPSGTGKTLAAEIIAKELRLDLQRLDSSTVVSKYIGESEKNLAKIFDAAESGGNIIFLDEGEVLLGKRGEVEGGSDRYANQEVAYMLQRIEAFRGLVIITTNKEGDIDDAFLRRIRFVVRFRLPEKPQRETLWRGAFPSETPLELGEADYKLLSQLEFAGGNIRNTALNATFFAMDEGVSVGLQHLYRSARDEISKMKRNARPEEFDGWPKFERL